MNFDKGLAYLAQHGLNLVAVFDTEQLPEDVIALLSEGGFDLANYQRLVILGNGGRDFWQAFSQQPRQTDAPVDHFSIGVTTQFVEETLVSSEWQLLYPGPMPLPLQRLGELAGWCNPSPIGSGISTTYGLWFAYRAAFLTTANLPITIASVSPSPCKTCTTRDCVATCPSHAVQWDAPLKLDACVDHRLQPRSTCATQCLARLSCPYASEHRYTPEQVHYHYNHSHDSLRHWMARQQAQDDA